MIAIVRPTTVFCEGDDILVDGDLTIELTTSELQQIEANLIHEQVRDGELSQPAAFRLECVEREINRRWGLSY